MSITNYRFGNKMIWRLTFFGGIVVWGLGLTNVLVAYFVNLGVEWISPNDLGLSLIGLLIMFSAGIAEKITDKLFKEYGDLTLGKYEPEEEEEPEEDSS